MRLKRRTLLGLAASTTILSGCTGGPGSQATDAPTDTATATPTAAAPHVRARSHPELGEILVDAEGMTLYMFDRDTKGAGASACSGGCLENWPPLTADDPRKGDGVTASLSTFERESGAPHVAAAGWPLYYFAADERPGDANGQGAGDVWWVLRPDGTPVKPESTATATAAAEPTVGVRSHPDLGDILVDADGMTLYMFDRDTKGAGASACSGGCLENWPPLTVEGDPTRGGSVTASLTTFEREGGTRQVAAAGWPLYYFARDEASGDANGQGAGDVWWVLRPDGTPIKPTAAATTGGAY